MAVFRKRNSQRLDWALLQNGPITLYYRPTILESDLTWLRAHDYHIDPLDCARWQTADDLHTAIAAQLAFPDYYGRNLAALNDCLRDLSIPEESGRVLVFHRYDAFAARFPDLAWHILDIVAVQARYFLLFGRRLMALVQSNDPQIAFSAVGACPVRWNRKEWGSKNRDLGMVHFSS